MSNTPVVFIPGITGSFNLQVLLDWRPPTLNGWSFPPFVDYGKGFVEAFQRAGYRRDEDLFVAFYDWRKAVKDTAFSYLMPWIDRARSRSGSPRVILIGHSMGSLVARSYIQSTCYRGDVEQLITVGTPHQGSANSYDPWQGGVIDRYQGAVKVVLEVYLWYLEHANPIATRLDRLRTIRTQIPALRDLLPTEDYLFTNTSPPEVKPEHTMVERNLWGDVINRPELINLLFERVPVTTIGGHDLTTLEALVVGGPQVPPGNPPRYPDGVPVEDRNTTVGDDTVLLRSARLDDSRVNNLPPVEVHHAELADSPQALAQIFGVLGQPAPALPAPQPMEPRLVIMSASPVTLSVAPVAEAGVLGGAGRRRARVRRVQARNYGHSGKHLNMVIIPNPVPGASYDMQVQGTATGSFSIGAVLVSGAAVGVLGAGEVPQPAATAITTRGGAVVAGTELHYRVTCPALDAPPEVSFDAVTTAQSLLTTLGAAVRDAATGVLGAGAAAAAVSDVLGALPAEVRDQVDGALAGDAAMGVQLAEALAGGARQEEAATAVSRITARVVAPTDPTLAAALLEQTKQIVEQR